MGSKQDPTHPHHHGDASTLEDLIGFEPQAKAAVEHLLLTQHRPHALRVSVEGKWGQGKSSYMRMMREQAKAAGCATAWIDVWRAKDHQNLWASVVLDLVEDLHRSTGLGLSLWAGLRGFGASLKRTFLGLLYRPWRCLGLLVVCVVAAYFVALLMQGMAQKNVTDATSVFEFNHLFARAWWLPVVLTVLAGLGKSLAEAMNQPLVKLLRAQLKQDQRPAAPSIDRYRQKLDQAIRPYARQGKPVWVFVDDMDRLNSAHASELVWAFHQLFDDEVPVVLVMGIDRDKIAAGIAKARCGELEYLPEHRDYGATEPPQDNGQRAISHAHAYLEKVIQTRLEVPVADSRGIVDFAKQIALIAPPDQVKPLCEALLMCADAVGYNPRRLKHVAADTVMWMKTRHALSSANLFQAAKLVTLRLGWPNLWSDLQRYPRLLSAMAYTAELDAGVAPECVNDQYVPSGPMQACWVHWSDRLNASRDTKLAALFAQGVSRDRLEVDDWATLLEDRQRQRMSLIRVDLRDEWSAGLSAEPDAALRSSEAGRKPGASIEKSDEVDTGDQVEPPVEAAATETPEPASIPEPSILSVSEPESVSDPGPDLEPVADATPEQDPVVELTSAEKTIKPEVSDADREYRNAKAAYRRAAKSAGPEDAAYRKALSRLAKAARESSRLDEAADYLQKLLKIAEKTLGRDHPDYATTLNNIGLVRDSQGDYAGALSAYEDSLPIYERSVGRDHPDYAATLNNIGHVRSSQGNYAGALSAYEESLVIYENSVGRDHHSYAVTLNNIGSVRDSQGDYAGALFAYEDSLPIYERSVGRDHPDYAATLNNIGLVRDSQGDYAGALSAYEESLAIKENSVGRDHPSYAVTLNNIGSVRDSQGDYADALSAYEESLAICEKSLGRDHPDYATALNNIGIVRSSQGDYTSALSAYEESLAIYEKLFGRDHPDYAWTLNNIGLVRDSQGDYVGALSAYEDSLAVYEKSFGRDHPGYAWTLNNIGHVRFSQGDYVGVLSAYEESLAIYEKSFGRNHPDYARTLALSAEALRAQQRLEEAVTAADEARATFQRVFGPDHWRVAQAIGVQAGNRAAAGDPDGALTLAWPALQRLLEVNGPRDRRYTVALAKQMRDWGGDPVAEVREQFDDATANTLAEMMDL